MHDKKEFKQVFMKYTPWQFPENPFDYVELASNPGGIGRIPQDRIGTKICVIGAGCSGLCAAYELMRIGLHPVIYESARNSDGTPRIGGRAFTYRFPGDPNALAELGAMRIPAIHRTIKYYMDQFEIDYSQPFPDPLVVPTTLYFDGKRYFIPVGGSLPPGVQRAFDAWKALVTPIIEKMARVWDNPILRGDQWREFLAQYANKSFYQILYEQGLSRREIKLFGSLGFGTGGFDSMYRISFIEIVRLVVCKWEVDQRLIKGGTTQIPMSFWTKRRECVRWGQSSLRQLNGGRPLVALKEINTPADPREKVRITDIDGNMEEYDAVIVTCSPRALEMDVRVNRRTFSNEVWTAMRNIHTIRSGKVFVRTKSAFWKNRAPESTINCTITDEAVRGTYLFDFDDTPSGVICLSYTWEDAATKFNALNEEDRVRKCIHTLTDIYGKDFISDQVVETVSYYWEIEKGFNGAFNLTYPGQYDDQLELFFQPVNPPPELHNGVFLSGETTSMAGGWIEGAIHGALDTAMAVIRRLGGEVTGEGATTAKICKQGTLVKK
ncbi:MAG: FAD-dependent oxidoreductase [Deltaproteobacteria bacterium]|nr:FAD-dependent oxidoreductase [Deltaproteobacteria bacterium]